MTQQGTSTIVQYERSGDLLVAWVVQRAWQRGAFVETARWHVPGGIAAIRRETVYGIPPGPLTYGRADLLAAGFVKPSLYMFDAVPCLRLTP